MPSLIKIAENIVGGSRLRSLTFGSIIAAIRHVKTKPNRGSVITHNSLDKVVIIAIKKEVIAMKIHQGCIPRNLFTLFCVKALANISASNAPKSHSAIRAGNIPIATKDPEAATEI